MPTFEIPQPKQEKGEEESREMLKKIKELREPLQKILEQLRPHLETGEYQLLVGDDASGRIPTLILRRVMKEVYKKRGYPNLGTIFFVGRKPGDEKRSDKIEGIRDHVKTFLQTHNLKNIKALIVTEAVASGSSAKVLKDALGLAGVAADLVSVGLEWLGTKGLEEGQEELERKLGCKVFSGMKGTPDIYRKNSLAGVKKYSFTDIHASKLKKEDLLFSEKEEDAGEAREDVKRLADELFEWYKKYE